MSSLRMLLGDEQQLVLAGLRRLVEQIEGVDVVGETDSGRDMVAMARQARPALVVMEVAMKELNGIDAARQIKEAVPGCKVLMLSAQASDAVVRAALKAGASGILLKDAAPEELGRAIAACLDGRVYLSPGLEQALLDDGQEGAFDRLSPRQRQVLQLLAEGHSMREISGMLGVSIKTVETHRAAIMERLGVARLASLVLYAIREKLVNVPELSLQHARGAQ